MRTTKPIATISYNSPQYLEDRLNELVKCKKIAFWAFIPHEPEDDEAGKKPHIHLFIEPAKLIQTEDLREAFKEPDPKSQKPLGVIAFRSSKFDHWYMYSKHDAAYLASKNESRRFHYEYDAFRTSDEDDLLCRVRTIDLLNVSPYSDMMDAMNHGVNWIEYVSRGTIPIQQLRNYKLAWEIMQMNSTYRAGRTTHTPKDGFIDTPSGDVIDASTGEVIEDLGPVIDEDDLSVMLQRFLENINTKDVE